MCWKATGTLELSLVSESEAGNETELTSRYANPKSPSCRWVAGIAADELALDAAEARLTVETTKRSALRDADALKRLYAALRQSATASDETS